MNYWAIYKHPHATEIHSPLNGQEWRVDGLSVRHHFNNGDFVYLLWQREFLYGWGYVTATEKYLDEQNGTEYLRASIIRNGMRGGALIPREQFIQNTELANIVAMKPSSLEAVSPHQARILNLLLRSWGVTPPDPPESPAEDWKVIASPASAHSSLIPKLGRQVDEDGDQKSPLVFISYTHESVAHKAWIRSLAEKLVNDGVDVILDQWDLRRGQDVLAL